MSGWTIHARNCGEITLGGLTYSIDVVRYRDDEPDMISICFYTADEARVTNYTADQARDVYRILGAALDVVSDPAQPAATTLRR